MGRASNTHNPMKGSISNFKTAQPTKSHAGVTNTVKDYASQASHAAMHNSASNGPASSGVMGPQGL